MREALPNSEICAVHRRHYERQATVQPAPEEENQVETIYKNKPVAVRYKGSSSYWIKGVSFTADKRVQLVPYDTAEYLVDEMPELFEIEE
ncbi:MAG: hypothetical protein PHZ19_08515 [Candidatus Thermoplasmatota archaeon]|nr:hypothetical protein [Candidatus Thermoplasmatota archaeon]